MRLGNIGNTSSATDVFVKTVVDRNNLHIEKAKESSNGQISFRDDIHEYRSVHSKNVYTSVTTFIGQFQKPFKAEYWSYYKALESVVIATYGQQTWYAIKRKLKEFRALDREDDGVIYMKDVIKQFNIPQVHIKVEHLRQQWDKKRDDACAKGTAFHNKKEEESYSNGYDSINNMIVPTSLKYSFDLSKLEDGFHAELLVYNDYFQIAGKIDKCIIKTEGNKRYVYIDDYKTNEKITKRNEFQSLKPPISHLDDCKWNIYRLQLSMYGVLLELAGYKVKHLQLTHCTDFGEFPEPFTILRDEIHTILKYRANQLYN